MGLEAATYLNDLVSTNPTGADGKSSGDDHIRLMKTVLQATFPGLAGRSFRTQQKSSNYSLLATDNLSFVECTANLTLTTGAAIATLGNGFFVVVFANGGNVTFDPNSSETINDGTTTAVVIPNGSWGVITSGPSRWSVVQLGGSRGNNSITADTTLTLLDVNKLHYVTDASVITLPLIGTLKNGDEIPIRSLTVRKVIIQRQGSDPIDNGAATTIRLPAYTTIEFQVVTGVGWVINFGPEVMVGDIKYKAHSTAEVGWVAADGGIYSQIFCSGLYDLIGTTFNLGDEGAGNFRVPNLLGRSMIGSGAGATIEHVTASSSNGFTVAANDAKWITGMAVNVSNLTGFGGSVTAGAFFVYRASSTNVRLCSTLAIAQNATTASMETITGSGTATLTHSLTTRTLGQVLGEEGHAMSLTEMLSHTHPLNGGGQVNLGGGSSPAMAFNSPTASTSARGGNATANTMQPGLVLTPFIKL